MRTHGDPNPTPLTIVTTRKEWDSMLQGPHPVAALFMDSESAPGGSLEEALQEVAAHHREKARYLCVDNARVPDVVEAAGISGRPTIQVYKHGQPAGQPISSARSTAELEEMVVRHIQVSQPA